MASDVGLESLGRIAWRTRRMARCAAGRERCDGKGKYNARRPLLSVFPTPKSGRLCRCAFLLRLTPPLISAFDIVLPGHRRPPPRAAHATLVCASETPFCSDVGGRAAIKSRISVFFDARVLNPHSLWTARSAFCRWPTVQESAQIQPCSFECLGSAASTTV